MRNVDKPYQIEEILPCTFYLRLEWRPPYLPWYLIDPGCEFVWLVDVAFPFPIGWTKQELSLFGDEHCNELMAKVSGPYQVDLLIPTDRYANDFALRVYPTTMLLQVHEQPPDYLDPKRIRGPQLFKQLNRCQWRLMFDVPNDDPGGIWSPDRDLLQRALNYTLWVMDDPDREAELRNMEQQGKMAPPYPLL